MFYAFAFMFAFVHFIMLTSITLSHLHGIQMFLVISMEDTTFSCKSAILNFFKIFIILQVQQPFQVTRQD